MACLCTLNRIDGLMCTFAHLLWQNILELIIQQQHKVDVSEDRLDKGKLLVMKMNSEQTDCHMLDIFSLVSTVLYILNDSFLHLPVITDREMDPSDCDYGVTLMTLVGMEIGEKVAYFFSWCCTSQTASLYAGFIVVYVCVAFLFCVESCFFVCGLGNG